MADESTESVRLEKARTVALAGHGMFADDSGRSLVDELLAERHAEAAREAGRFVTR